MNAPVRIRRLALFGTSGVVGRCRDFAQAALVDFGWLPALDQDGQDAAEDVLLVVSELITNACLHAGGPQEIALALHDGLLRIEVSDADPRPPVPSPFGLAAEGAAAQPGGHGLRVVARLSRSWGCQEHGGGKTVWSEIPAPGHLLRT
ncbi:ATP-binding protein [Kitasatospora sp. MAP5-34]|uniref:ATP-binding protein n=1 Tax=Kitasatospora sp. MAP5-34 TaxID=3035102 RepID=UPI000A702F7F|nr:ATP-binding protein [Kitasatospora sp. MAP5-34]MDH6574641.1 anti-sigma regulatory factor (Ser/Thr protein kinase) [Kitasatospora sp. MAP5-34]